MPDTARNAILNRNDSLKAQFDALHAERERTWSQQQLQTNIDQRHELLAAYDSSKHIKVGDVLPDFELQEVERGLIRRQSLSGLRGYVLIFFRFAGCPACNIALPHYNKTLWPALSEAGLALIAVSPQIPERLIEIKTRHQLAFLVASDTDNRLGKALGITFEPLEKPVVQPGDSWIGETLGTHDWTLPQPTVIVADRDGRVQFIDVSPDWLNRTETPDILAAAARL